MADQRQYNVFASDHFDGSTVATEALAWVPGANTQSAPANVRYRSVSTTLVGLFPPTILGRDGRAAALVRVWADRVSDSDNYAVIGSSDVADANPQSTVRASALLTTGQQGATILELGMTDQLKIATSAPTMVHIEVIDLDEAQQLAYVLAKFRNDAEQPGGLSEITVTASQVIPSVPGHLVVNCDMPTGGILDLPDLTALALSPGDRITFYRSAGDPGQTLAIRTQNGSNLVNGLGGVVATQYFLRDKGDSVSYLVTPGYTYQREFGEQASIEVMASTNPFVTYVPKGGIGFMRDEATTLDNQANLPTINDPSDFIPSGAMTILVNTDTQRHQAVPVGGGEVINAAKTRWYIQPGMAAMFIALRSATHTGYRAIGGGNQGRTVSSGANITLTADDVNGNVCTVETTGAAGQDLVLPPVAQVANGSMIVWLNSSANTHDLIPNGTDEINNVNAAGTLATLKRLIIVAGGPAIGWITILTA